MTKKKIGFARYMLIKLPLEEGWGGVNSQYSFYGNVLQGASIFRVLIIGFCWRRERM
jgi:hypothetical protein